MTLLALRHEYPYHNPVTLRRFVTPPATLSSILNGALVLLADEQKQP